MNPTPTVILSGIFAVASLAPVCQTKIDSVNRPLRATLLVAFVAVRFCHKTCHPSQKKKPCGRTHTPRGSSSVHFNCELCHHNNHSTASSTAPPKEHKPQKENATALPLLFGHRSFVLLDSFALRSQTVPLAAPHMRASSHTIAAQLGPVHCPLRVSQKEFW